ncbi:MAG: tRNA (adenosine(37)-N6)-threonylcarbamoyltransferase complex dimerization subunit type 1 TsaB [Planctomycetota bacterium]
MNARGRIELAVSASSAEVAVAARDGERSACERSRAGRGGDDVVVLAARVIERLGARASDIARVVVDRGPGSYTGLRVALTFARTLAGFQGCALATLTSTELLAWQAWHAGDVAHANAITVVLDARRGHDHFARLVLDGGRIRLLDGPRAVRNEELRALLPGTGDVLADETVRTRLSASSVDGVRLQPLRAIDPAAAFDPRLCPQSVTPDALEPLYLLPSYAEDSSAGT